MSKSNDTQPWLWTDFLCINQDSIQEKDEQISRMGEIYSNARQTIAWLGRSDPSPSQIQPQESVEHHMSEIPIALKRPPLLWESLQRLFESSQRCWTNWMRRVRYADVHSEIWVREGLKLVDVLKELLSQVSEAVRFRYNPWITAAVDKVLSLDYWKRVWIVQEVALAKKVELRYGDTTLDFDDFIRAYQGQCFNRWTLVSQIWETEAVAAVEARIAGDDITVRGIIEWSQRCECSFPVDRVKGLLALLRKQRPDPKKENAVYAYLDAVFATPLHISGGIVDLADYEPIVDQLGTSLLGQPSLCLDMASLESYSRDDSRHDKLLRMARAARFIAITCAAIGFGSARVSKDSFDWRPPEGSTRRALFDH